MEDIFTTKPEDPSSEGATSEGATTTTARVGEQQNTAQPAVFKKGSKGPEVSNIQTMLGNFYTSLGGTVDESYGPKTYNAVIGFQNQWNTEHPEDQIDVDGIVGGQTMQRLKQFSFKPEDNAGHQPATVKTETAPAVEVVKEEGIKPEDYTFTESQLFGGDGAQPAYKADWASGISFHDAVQGSDHSIADMVRDYNKYAADNDKEPLDVFDIMSEIQDKDMNKSVKQNAADEKKRIRQERFQQIGNVLQHIGNFVGTISGAPSQTIESGVELTNRQKLLRDVTEKRRRDTNNNFLQLLYKDRNDKRAADKHAADVGLIQQRVAALQAEEERKRQKNDADIAAAGARQKAAEQEAALTQAKINTENQLRPHRIAREKSVAYANNSRGSLNRAMAKKQGQRTRSDWAKLYEHYRATYPEEFQKAYDIHAREYGENGSKYVDKQYEENVVLAIEEQLAHRAKTKDYSQYEVK